MIGARNRIQVITPAVQLLHRGGSADLNSALISSQSTSSSRQFNTPRLEDLVWLGAGPGGWDWLWEPILSDTHSPTAASVDPSRTSSVDLAIELAFVHQVAQEPVLRVTSVA